MYKLRLKNLPNRELKLILKDLLEINGFNIADLIECTDICEKNEIKEMAQNFGINIKYQIKDRERMTNFILNKIKNLTKDELKDIQEMIFYKHLPRYAVSLKYKIPPRLLNNLKLVIPDYKKQMSSYLGRIRVEGVNTNKRLSSQHSFESLFNLPIDQIVEKISQLKVKAKTIDEMAEALDVSVETISKFALYYGINLKSTHTILEETIPINQLPLFNGLDLTAYFSLYGMTVDDLLLKYPNMDRTELLTFRKNQNKKIPNGVKTLSYLRLKKTVSKSTLYNQLLNKDNNLLQVIDSLSINWSMVYNLFLDYGLVELARELNTANYLFNLMEDTYSRQIRSLKRHKIWRDILKDSHINLDQSLRNTVYNVMIFRQQDDSVLCSLYKKYSTTELTYPSTSAENMLLDLPRSTKDLLKNDDLLKIDYFKDKSSKEESKLADLLDYHNIKYIKNDRTRIDGLKPAARELDFYIPDSDIGIEISPNYTHNSNTYHKTWYNTCKEKNYHFDKFNVCESLGIKLITLFSWDLADDIFEMKTWPRLKTLLNIDTTTIYARNCYITELTDDAIVKRFLNTYHSDGYIRSSKKYGIYNKIDNELVGVATIGSPTHPTLKKRYDLELKRLAFKHGYKIIGGTSKLIKYILKNNSIKTLMTYSDNNWGTGVSYEKSGFTLIKNNKPTVLFVSNTNGSDTYSWQINSKWGARSGVVGKDLLKKGFKSYNDEPFNILKYIETELDHKADNKKGYDQMYDCGNKLWVINKI